MKIGKSLINRLDKKTIVKVSILISIFTVATAVVYFTPLRQYANPHQLENLRKIKGVLNSFGYWAPLVFIAAFAVKAIIPFPSSAFMVFSGLAFGPFYGAVYSIVGSVISAGIAYQIAQRLGRDFVVRVLGRKAKALDRFTNVHGLPVVLFFRIVPSLPFDVFNLGAGLSDITFGDFIIGTAIGMTPWSFAMSYLGDKLENLNLFSLLSFFLIIAIIALPIFIKKFSSTRKKTGP